MQATFEFIHAIAIGQHASIENRINKTTQKINALREELHRLTIDLVKDSAEELRLRKIIEASK